LVSTFLGPILWFLKYFRRKIQQKLAFFTQNKAKLFKILIITLVFEKNANFFTEKCRKSQKIVIITLTPEFKYFYVLWNELFRLFDVLYWANHSLQQIPRMLVGKMLKWTFCLLQTFKIVLYIRM
jgi:hypothetical protein